MTVQSCFHSLGAAIIEYLDDVFLDRRLLPRSAFARFQVWLASHSMKVRSYGRPHGVLGPRGCECHLERHATARQPSRSTARC